MAVFSMICGFLTDFSVIVYIVAVLFCIRHKRRKLFWLRFLPTSALFLALPYLIPGGYVSPYLTAGWFMFSFPIFVALLAGIIFLCFDIKPLNVVYYVGMAYTVQNLAYRMRFLVCDLFHITDFFLSFVLALVIHAAVIAAFYFFVIRRISASFRKKDMPYVILTCAAVLSVVYVFDMVVRAYGLQNVATQSYAVFICLALIIVQMGLFKQSRYEDEEFLMNELLKMEHKQHELSEENLAIINVKFHDLKHQLNAMRNTEWQKNNLDEIEHSLNVYDAFVKSGNEVLDIVLTEKCLICDSKKIRTGLIIDGSAVSFIDPSDLWVLFGNIFNNAIEAVEELDIGKRIIKMNVSRQKGFVVIHEDNWCERELTFRGDGLPETTSDDKGFHGYGTRSIKMIAEKYGGSLKICCEDNVYSIDIMLPER